MPFRKEQRERLLDLSMTFHSKTIFQKSHQRFIRKVGVKDDFLI